MTGKASLPGVVVVYDSGSNTYVEVSSANPLPTSGGSGSGGDASAANQTTGNASLSSIDTKTPALGQALAASSSPVVLTAAQITTLTPPAAITGFATAAKQPTLGAGVTSASTPVNIASDQVVPVSATTLPLPTGAATAALQTSGGQTVQISSATQAPYGIVAKVSPFGELTVSASTIPLFVDNFDSAIDTTDRWTLSGTQVPVNTNGAIVLSLGATNSISSVAISQPTFSPTLQSYVLATQLNIGAAQSNPNCHRFWGQGQVTSYATATPLTDGFGVEIDLTGALNLVYWISGTRYVINSTNASLITASGSWAAGMTASTYGQTMTWPSAGIATFVMRYVNGTVFFYSNVGSGVTFDVPIGVISCIPAVVTLPIRYAAITTAAVSTVLATTFTGSGLVLGGALGNTINDPTMPFRSATVKKASTAAATTDLPLVVALHPSTVPAVTVTSTTALTPGVAAANLGKAEDAVSASGDTGVFVLGVRRDTLTTSASATGDYNEVALDQYGASLIKNYEKHARTYSCAINVAAAASATDIATITGSASTTVFVTKVIISGIQTTAGLSDVLLVKRSTADTSGTSTSGTALPHDSSDAAATATVLAYTANPTLGTTVATLRRNYLPVAGATSVVNPVVTYDFGERGRPLVLRGIAQVLAVNLNGVTLTGGTFDINFEWFEI